MNAPPILAHLTDDLLPKIVSLLADDSDRRSFSSTCKTFYRVDSLNRTHLRVLRPEFLPSLLSKIPRIASLDLSVCPRIDAAAISLILSFAAAAAAAWTQPIRWLQLSRCTGLRFPGLEALARSCANLESVDISYCAEFDDLEVVGLRELNLGDAGRVCDGGELNLGNSKIKN